eukprot:5963285-Lingulodinium_polyedra.AAC.1
MRNAGGRSGPRPAMAEESWTTNSSWPNASCPTTHRNDALAFYGCRRNAATTSQNTNARSPNCA